MSNTDGDNEIVRVTELCCTRCGEVIKLGQRRKVGDIGMVHELCLTVTIRWTGEAMKLSTIHGFEVVDLLPEWVVTAADNGVLRRGEIGVFERLPDGSWEFDGRGSLQ